ncbi:hypothetical protein MHYP_G00091490 [Metynnis hypsauchen]
MLPETQKHGDFYFVTRRRRQANNRACARRRRRCGALPRMRSGRSGNGSGSVRCGFGDGKVTKTEERRGASAVSGGLAVSGLEEKSGTRSALPLHRRGACEAAPAGAPG